jgi:hypothetical protein
MKTFILFAQSLVQVLALLIGSVSFSAHALNTPTHYGCTDIWNDPEGSATNAITPKGLQETNKIFVTDVAGGASEAEVTFVYRYASATQALPSPNLALLGARLDGANLTATITYPLRFSDPIRATFFAERKLALPKPSPGDYRLIAQIPYGCALGVAATLPISGGNSQWILRVAGPRPTVIVSTLTYLPATRNFMTASLTEVQALRTAPGIGSVFALLDDNFRAWPTLGDAPPNVVSVCRLFRASTLTHTYSANNAECESLRANPQWSYEGIAFRALVPTNGACASGTEPVYKLTNATLGDTQRHTRSEMTYRTLALNGWTQQGIAFCSPVG